MNRLSLERYIAAVLRHRWLVAGLATLVMLALTAGAQFVVIKNDHRVLFGEDNPQLAAFDALENTYTASNSALIAVAPRKGTVFTREVLVAMEELTAAGWEAPHSSRVDSLTNYTHSEADGDDLIVEPLVEDAQALSDADLARVEKIALSSPEVAGRLVSRDGRVAGLVITFVLPEDSDPAVIEITDYLRNVLEKARAGHPDVDYYLTGLVVMNRAFAQATEDDLGTLAPVVFLIIVTGAALLLRSVWGTVSLVLVLVFSVNTTMGFAGWMGAVFSPANAGVPIIVMAISVANSVHIVAATLLGMSRGLGKDEAIAEALRADVYPVFLTAATTAIGFLSLNSSDSPPFHVLGNFVAFGVGCAFLYAVTLLPATLSLLPLRAPRARAESLPFFDRLGAFVVARRRVLLWTVLLAAAALATGVPRIHLTDNWTRYFDHRYEFRRHTDFVVDNLTSLNTLEY
ncbi:MAG: MMPL family transporter, partial [Deltaproteobacteria bacterium]|nr:MMPL family transporter [Deltaproteobacteria bacterium]